MKYYSELLDKMFDSEDELNKAEKESVDLEKNLELSEKILELYESILALENKADELDDKLAEMDVEYENLTGHSWFYDMSFEDEEICRKNSKNYVVEVAPPSECHDYDCQKKIEKLRSKSNSKISKVANDEFVSVIEKEFPALAKSLRRFMEDM